MSFIALSVGELSLPTYAPVAKAGIEAIKQGLTHYGPTEGIYELRAAIADHYNENQNNIGPENVLITSGVRQAVHNVLQCLIKPADEVILPVPHWFAFPDLIERAGATIVPLETHATEDWAIDPEKLRSLITPKTKLFVFNNPCNPTGRVYTREEIDALVSVLEEFPHVYILSDEVYEFITYDGHKMLSLSSYDVIIDRVITVSGFSKSFAMAGWRVAYITGSETLIQDFKRYQEISLSGVSIFTQMAAKEALISKEKFLPQLLNDLHLKRDKAFDMIRQMKGLTVVKPQGTFYFFINTEGLINAITPKERTITNANDFCTYLLTQHHLQLFNGSNFGAEHHIRLSFSPDEELLFQGLDRLKNAISLLH
jgi:aspartate aminotransferase